MESAGSLERLSRLEVVVVDQADDQVVPMTPAGRRRKGSRVEREVVALHEAEGVAAKRVPLSGAQQGWRGDVRVGNDLVGEVKARKGGAGFAVLERWLGENDLLFVRRDRGAFLVVMPWRVYGRHARALAAEEGHLCEASASPASSD